MLWLLLLLGIAVTATHPNLVGYDNNTVIVNEMASLAAEHPDKASYHVFGTSFNGRTLAALILAPDGRLNASRPSALFSAGIHGDELVSVELLRRLAADRLANPNDWPDLDLVLIPLLNPDGRSQCRRTNAHYRDLNRCFPDRCNMRIVRCRRDTAPEVYAVMSFVENLPLSAAVGFHGGALTVSLPWDDNCTSHSRSELSPHPENELHEMIGNAYMEAYSGDETPEPKAVTNGAEWYQLVGGMQGWMLAKEHVSVAMTIETSMVKAPPASRIDNYWTGQKNSLKALMRKLMQSVTIRVIDEENKPVNASLVIIDAEGNDLNSLPIRNGIITRVMPTGTHVLRVRAPKYIGARIEVNIADEQNQFFLVQLRTLS